MHTHHKIVSLVLLQALVNNISDCYILLHRTSERVMGTLRPCSKLPLLGIPALLLVVLPEGPQSDNSDENVHGTN